MPAGIVTLAALATCASPVFAQGGGADDPCDAAPTVGYATPPTEGRVLYDPNGIECQVQAAATGAPAMYLEQCGASFDAITYAGLAGTVSIIPFVAEADTLTVAARGAVP